MNTGTSNDNFAGHGANHGAETAPRSLDPRTMQRVLALAEGPGGAEDKLERIRDELRAAMFDQPARASLLVNERQLKTLELLAQGLSNRSIARRLDLAEETVKCHVRSLLDRLNVPNRTSLALWAIREGVVPLHARPQPSLRTPADLWTARRPAIGKPEPVHSAA